MSGKLQNRHEIQSSDMEARPQPEQWSELMMQPQPGHGCHCRQTNPAYVAATGDAGWKMQLSPATVKMNPLGPHFIATSDWLHLGHVLDHPGCKGYWESE